MLTSLYRRGAASRLFDAVNMALLVLITLLMLYPLWYTIVLSFSSTAALNTNFYLWPAGAHIDNYQHILRLDSFVQSYRNTVVYSVTGTLLVVVLTIMSAYPLAIDTFPFRKFWMFFVTFTMLFSGGLIPLYLQVNKLGLINTIWAIILPGAISPYNIILMRTFFKFNVPVELREAAKIDGAGDWSILWHIVVPLSKPIIAVIALFAFVGHWNSYFDAMIFLTDGKRFPYALFLRALVLEAGGGGGNVGGYIPSSNIGDVSTIGVRAAGLMIAAVPLLAIYPFLQRYFAQGVLLGSLKG